MNYAQLVHELVNCSCNPAPCGSCSRITDDACTDHLLREAAIAIQNLSCEVSCEVLKIPCENPASDTQ